MWRYSSLVLTAPHSHFPEPDYPRSQMKPGSCFRAGPAACQSIHGALLLSSTLLGQEGVITPFLGWSPELVRCTPVYSW